MNVWPEFSDSLDDLLPRAADLRDQGHGNVVSYSPKVFVPLTQLCRDVCHYCTFAKAPSKLDKPYLEPEEVLRIAEQGLAAGCSEVLFTLGDKPELRYELAAQWLRERGHESTIDYLVQMCALVAERTGLLPHVNAGVMGHEDIKRLREVSASQGLMLETVSARLCDKGGAHHGSPDKNPTVRLQTLRALGECAVPTTTGLLIGIGETWQERIDSLLAIQRLHAEHGHIQEVIIQNFRPKPGTLMHKAAAPSLEELLRTVAAARLILGPQANIQVPPNLTVTEHERLLDAGINDWGGVSPVTIDHVNPEAPWPQVEALAGICERRGKTLVKRLPVYPSYALAGARWLAPKMHTLTLRLMDGAGFGREDMWVAGNTTPARQRPQSRRLHATSALLRVENKVREGVAPDEREITCLFNARGSELEAVLDLADRLREEVVGTVVRYAVNRNINYTNICTFGCTFCAFSKGGTRNLAGRPYDLSMDEVSRRTAEAWERGATEVCLQGGIHPDYTGNTYLEILAAVKRAAPAIHVHAFSPLEVMHGASTLGLGVPAFLEQLRNAGLGSLPGTAAEILDEEVRRQICPEKLTGQEWLEVMAAAHALGLRTTSTMMFGSVEGYASWSRHLLAIRSLQERTAGFTEFVPLPFVSNEAPMYRKGRARRGPTFRETLLVHAVARIALHGQIPNIQVSWVKMGRAGVEACLSAGANDLGGTLMNESISRAAGAQHGQELPPAVMREWIHAAGRIPEQRNTLYGPVTAERSKAAEHARPLNQIVLTPPRSRRTRQELHHV